MLSKPERCSRAQQIRSPFAERIKLTGICVCDADVYTPPAPVSGACLHWRPGAQDAGRARNRGRAGEGAGGVCPKSVCNVEAGGLVLHQFKNHAYGALFT